MGMDGALSPSPGGLEGPRGEVSSLNYSAHRSGLENRHADGITVLATVELSRQRKGGGILSSQMWHIPT